MGRLPSQLIERITHRRHREQQLILVYVVKPGNRQVIGNADTAFLEHGQCSKGHVVVGSDNRIKVRPRPQFSLIQYLVQGPNTTWPRVVTRGHEVWIKTQVPFLDQVDVGPVARICLPISLRSTDKHDPPAPVMVDQVGDLVTHALVVVDQYTRYSCARRSSADNAKIAIVLKYPVNRLGRQLLKKA